MINNEQLNSLFLNSESETVYEEEKAKKKQRIILS